MALADWRAGDGSGPPARTVDGAVAWALPVSVALHVAILLALAWSAEHFRPPPLPDVVVVEMVSLPPAEPDREPPPPELAPVEPVGGSGPVPPAKPVPVSKPMAPKAAPAARNVPVPAATTPGPGAEVPSAEAARNEPSGPAVAASPLPAGPVADEMGLYLAEVRRRLQANLDYPFAARRMKLGGTVHIRVHVAGDGGVEGRSIAVTTSSGADLLDEAGLVTVRRASPFPSPPGGQALFINVPVVFELRRG